jgi:hypothetical protein
VAADLALEAWKPAEEPWARAAHPAPAVAGLAVRERVVQAPVVRERVATERAVPAPVVRERVVQVRVATERAVPALVVRERAAQPLLVQDPLDP